MATTVLQAFRDVYGAISSLPTLRTAKIPDGEAREFPNAKITHRGTEPHYRKKDVAYRTVKVRFELWYTEFNDADNAAETLMAALTPEILVVTGVKPIVFVELYTLVEEVQRTPSGQYVYRATVDCRAESN